MSTLPFDLKSHPSQAFPREEWKAAAATERHARIRRRLLENARKIDLVRARLATESYRKTEDEPMPVRRARMLLHLARLTPIAIDGDEIIVGNRSIEARTGVIAPEGAVNWIDGELETLPTRPQDPFNITAAEIKELREEIFPYWRGQTLEDTVEARLSDEVKAAVRGKAFKLNQTDHAQGHILPDVPAWLRLGIGGLRAKVRAAQEANQKADAVFYASVTIALDAASEFIARYAGLADKQLATETNGARRNELGGISNACHWLREQPARNFREALQAVWFLLVLLQIESNASSFSLGRFDQYMLPYLERDIESGALTLPEAQELLEYFWLKCNEIVLLRSSSSARYFAGFSHRLQRDNRRPDGRRPRRDQCAELHVPARAGRSGHDSAQSFHTHP